MPSNAVYAEEAHHARSHQCQGVRLGNRYEIGAGVVESVDADKETDVAVCCATRGDKLSCIEDRSVRGEADSHWNSKIFTVRRKSEGADEHPPAPKDIIGDATDGGEAPRKEYGNVSSEGVPRAVTGETVEEAEGRTTEADHKDSPGLLDKSEVVAAAVVDTQTKANVIRKGGCGNQQEQ